MTKAARPTWDQYFMSMAELVSQRSTCLRRQVGAVIVKEKRILTTGYNGAPSGLPHCLDIGCLREQLGIPSGERHELCRAIHAEQNALVQAASFGVSVRGATLYATTFPCSLCSKMLINSGIAEIVARDGYPDDMSSEMLEQSTIRVRMFQSNSDKEDVDTQSIAPENEEVSKK